MVKYRVIANFWFYGDRDSTTIEREYLASSEEDARDLFWDDYPPMLGTGSIVSVEKIV